MWSSRFVPTFGGKLYLRHQCKLQVNLKRQYKFTKHGLHPQSHGIMAAHWRMVLMPDDRWIIVGLWSSDKWLSKLKYVIQCLFVSNTSWVAQRSNRGLCCDKTASNAWTVARIVLYVAGVLSISCVHLNTNFGFPPPPVHGLQSVLFWRCKHLSSELSVTVDYNWQFNRRSISDLVGASVTFQEAKSSNRQKLLQGGPFLQLHFHRLCAYVTQHATGVCHTAVVIAINTE
jgi:hypothetical protein